MALTVGNTLFNPNSYGSISRKELEENGVDYVRNQVSKALKEYVKEKFKIEDSIDTFHLEEVANSDNLLVVDNLNRVVSILGK